MNKQDLIDAIAKDTDATKVSIARVLDSFIDQVQHAVVAGNNVTLTGFGTFKKTDVSARAGRHPTTGESILLPATVKPRFVPSSMFKAKMKG